MAVAKGSVGAPYLVIDDDGEHEFCVDPAPVLKRVTDELDDSEGVDEFGVGVYKLVKLYHYRCPKPKGVLELVKKA